MMSDRILRGWKEIASYTPWTTDTVRKNYGPEMIRQGIVMKTLVSRGRNRRHLVWAYPSYVKAYFSKKLSRKE